MNQEALPQTPTELTLDEVLMRLVEETDYEPGEIDRIEIQRAAPHQWACRVYRRGEEEFDGVFISSE